MIRFCSLGSGSTGNATLIEATQAGKGGCTTRVLVDCGFSTRELDARLARVGLTGADLDAIFVTHEHGDHVGCAVSLARREGIALWLSRGTHAAIGAPALEQLRLARDGEAIDLGALQLLPYTVPHDAREPLQVVVSDGRRRLGVLTDAGSATPYMVAQLQRCDALLLECNHDRELLANSSYPASLKARIGGRFGHLANDLSAEILAACLHGGLKHVVAAHLSEQNNRPEIAAAALAAVLACRPQDIVVATPDAGSPWLGLD